MKKIFLYGDDLFLLARWIKLINNRTNLIENKSELICVKNSILVINISICKNISDEFIVDFVNNKNQILVLDNLPNFYNAKKYLSLGIKGYGNTLMTSSYLNSAIEALNNGFIWLLPDITTQLVNNIVDLDKQDDKNKDELLFRHLTVKEKQVAILLKKGYTNSKISIELKISINTVKTHIKHIYEKLSVTDRVAFASLFTK